MKILLRAECCLILSFLLLSPSAAQKQASASKASAATPTKLLSVKVTGSSRYTDQELTAASGLRLGQNAVDGDFKEAAQVLGSSGMFSDVSYSYNSSASGTKLEFQVSDIDSSKLVPLEFENFIWFSDDELLTSLQSRLPLFKKLLPVGGNLSDHASETLQAMLTEKHLPGRVTFLRSTDANSEAIKRFDYAIEEVSIHIRNVEFPGTSPEQKASLDKAAHRVEGAKYNRPALAAVAKFDLLPVMLQKGYLKAAFGPSDAHIVPQSDSKSDESGPAELEVDAIIPVQPGKIYSTESIDWKGNSAINTSELAPLLHLPIGQPANADRLNRDIENVGKFYRSRGYMVAQVKAESSFDDDKSTVHFEIKVVEGDLYKMGEFLVTGLDTQSQARMQAAWTLRKGQPYNADYPAKYIADTAPILPRGVNWRRILHETPDASDKTVDVEIHFQQQ